MSKRLVPLAALVAVCSFAAGSATGLAAGKPGERPFAKFSACMKENGAPGKPFRRLTKDERAALKRAFAACRELLPKPSGERTRHGFVRPTAEQVAAFKNCMADKGFSALERGKLREPAVRRAWIAALKVCLPLLRPQRT